MNAVPALSQFDLQSQAAHYKAVRERLVGPSVPVRVTLPPARIVIRHVKPLVPGARPPHPLDRVRYYSPLKVKMPAAWKRKRSTGPKPAEAIEMARLSRSAALHPLTKIIMITSAYYGVSYEDMIGPRGSRDFSRPRHIAMWICETTRREMSLPEIGRRFGNRDHTTVFYAVRKINRLIDAGELNIPPELLALTSQVGVQG